MNETKINELTDQISKVRAILNDLTAQLEAEKNKVEEKKEPSIEDRWKPNSGNTYFAINGLIGKKFIWLNDISSNLYYDSYNIWETEARAEEISNKTKLLWLMEQIYDILCPDYKPNWEDENEDKYGILFTAIKNRWQSYTFNGTCTFCAYFDTREHAEQACKILNDMGVKP